MRRRTWRQLYKGDPCYKFAWALDACVRQNALDSRLGKELDQALDQLAPPSAIGDVAMIAADPVVTTTLATSLVRIFSDGGSPGAAKDVRHRGQAPPAGCWLCHAPPANAAPCPVCPFLLATRPHVAVRYRKQGASPADLAPVGARQHRAHDDAVAAL